MCTSPPRWKVFCGSTDRNVQYITETYDQRELTADEVETYFGEVLRLLEETNTKK